MQLAIGRAMHACVFWSAAFALNVYARAPKIINPTMENWAPKNPREIGEPSERQSVDISGIQSTEESWRIPKPWNNTAGEVAWSMCHRLSAVVPLKTVKRLMDQFVGNSATFTDAADSVDGMPAFEFYAASDGEWRDKGVKKLLQRFVQKRILPYVRQKLDCPHCSMSDVLVRRYAHRERRTHDVHFDGHAFATVVLGLSSLTDYSGGLFVASEAHISARRFIRIPPGDLVLHRYDLQHGVHVWNGTRYSLVLWIKDSKASVRAGTSPWYAGSAAANDIDAMFNLGNNFLDGLAGLDENVDKALELFGKSASAGHHMAQCNLGNLYAALYNQTGDKDFLSEAFQWLGLAAESGYAKAQKSLAFLLARESSSAQIAGWMTQAAEQVDMEAACVLGQFYLRGEFGVQVSIDKALSWFRLSAEIGYPEAQLELGLLQSTGPDADFGEAKYWLTKIAKRGDGQAALRLADLHAKRGEFETAVLFWKQLAEAGFADAQFQLGQCYAHGRGVKQDLKRADEWMLKAEDQGHSLAQGIRQSLG